MPAEQMDLRVKLSLGKAGTLYLDGTEGLDFRKPALGELLRGAIRKIEAAT
jgi:hypothetical protein